MQRASMFYRTKDGLADYRFEFEEQGDCNWRAYVAWQPPYQGRPSDCHSTHRLSDGPKSYICWTHPLRSLSEAKQVAAMWADMTQRYIKTGMKF